MSAEAERVLANLRANLRPASVARIGGFRPSQDPAASWFGVAASRPDEGIPTSRGKPMIPLLQVRVAELPYVPRQLDGIALFSLFLDPDEYPFDKPHGEGWLIREYTCADGLVSLPKATAPTAPRPFPIAWDRVSDDAPGWEDAWGLADMAALNGEEVATARFFDDFNRYRGTKIGGYPAEIQHGVGLENFVFQVASEPKARWSWADGGTGYFFRDGAGAWSWSCQFY